MSAGAGLWAAWLSEGSQRGLVRPLRHTHTLAEITQPHGLRFTDTDIQSYHTPMCAPRHTLCHTRTYTLTAEHADATRGAPILLSDLDSHILQGSMELADPRPVQGLEGRCSLI